MSMPIILRRAAQAEFDDAVDWYGQKNNRGAAFALAVKKALEQVAANPFSYPEVFEDVREILVRKYPYVIYYRILSNTIVVISVFHTSRDPAIWQARVDS
jgi:plasmid stabilization system protein ParE